MDAAILVALFLAFMITSLPIGIAVGGTVVAFCLLFPDEVGGMSFIYQNMFSALNNFPILAVPFFMLAGSIMETGGLSKRIVNVATKMVGNATAGLAIVSILACMLFGAISGSAPATVASIGGVMIPAMVKYKYPINFTAGLMSCAGGLGVIIPPSIPLIIYGVSTGTSISNLFLAGIMPGIVLTALLMIAAYIVGRKRGYVGTGHIFSGRELLAAIWDAKWALLMPVVILGGIYTGVFTPTEASVIGCVLGLIVGFFIYRELTWSGFMRILVDNGILVGSAFLMFGTIASLSFLVSITDIPYRASELIESVTQSKIVVLLLVNVFLLIAGMFMDPTSANLVFSPLLLTIVEPMGVNPVHFGMIVTLNLAMGFVTPPLAPNAFLTSTLTGVPVMSIVRESLPFLVAMFITLIIVTYFPQVSLLPLILLGRA